MICRRVCKCEPLFRFNPQNLAKIVCFAEWVKGAKCVCSDILNEKVFVILTCIILKIKAQLKQLVNWKLWFALFYPEQSVEFWQHLHISQASQAHMWCRKKIILKKITEANFSNLVSYLLYAYLKKSTEKLLAKSILWAKLDMRILRRLALKHKPPDYNIWVSVCVCITRLALLAGF